MPLGKYNKKRDFNKTSEPPGELKSSENALTFVVQLHAASRLHYDFRLEWDGVLLSWAVPKGPSYNTKDKRLAVQVEDHPVDYSSFEGTIPQEEYGGGTVMIWDKGEWVPVDEDVNKGLSEGMLKFELKGERLKGNWVLVRMKPREGETDKNWLLIKEKDEYVQEDSGFEKFDTSAVSGRTMDEIAEALPFTETDLALAKLTEDVPRGDHWIHEIKFDGYRILAFVEDGQPRLITRNGHDWTDKFPKIAAAISKWNPPNLVVDGEIVVLSEEGKSDFQALQSALENPDKVSMHYILFDLLALLSQDLRDEALLSRKAQLEKLLEDAPAEILYSFHQKGQGEQVFEQACAKGQEGIISKRADSKYRAGRGGSWLKIKCDRRQEFVIGGYTTTDKSRTGLSSLLLGLNEEEGLRYYGRAGTGFSDETSRDLVKKLNRLERKTSPFIEDIDERDYETITYVTPKLLAEIKYAEITNDGLLRQASFKGLREDKNPDSVQYGDIRLSSPDKVLFPDDEISKKDVADYYWAIKDEILPYLANRPLTLIRCTNGIGEECFFQKNMFQNIPGMDTFPFKRNNGEDAEAMVIRDASALMGAVQMGAVEFHSWGSVTDTMEQPDMMVFDLDPDEGLDLEDVRQAVEDLKDLLTASKLNSYLKTSGGKGYHVVVPLKPSADWTKVRDFAKLIAKTMTEKWPDRYTDNMRKVNRKGRVFVDWVRNGRGATSVVNFSLRSRKGAPISWPLRWSDLNEIRPNEVNLKSYRDYMHTLKGWEDFYQQEQKLK
ncbi:MAG: DNA ligase D [Eubacteriales bacterium]|nr:DNA ligase D [Eubacteriales bacterium]